MRRAFVLLLAAAASPAAAQTPDRYGYAPPAAQLPMRQPVRTPALRAELAAPTPAQRVQAAAPRLRMLSWPGKGVAEQASVLRASAPVAATTLRPAPAVRPTRSFTPPVAPSTAAPRATAWTPRTRWTAGAPVASVLTPAVAPSPTAGVGPAPRPTFIAPPGLIAQSPVAPPAPVVARAALQGAAALGPPQTPWYERWPDAAAAPDPTVHAGVGASLAPGTPSAPPSTAPLTGYAPPPTGAAPVRTASAAPMPRSTAKYYSVHTAYGHAPDPAPIPPQFFGPTADLSAPETPEPARATLTANPTAAKAAVNAARLQQGAVE